MAPLADPTDAARLRRVDRILGELRRGTPIVIQDDSRAALVLAAETGALDGLAELAALSPHEPELILTERRAQALGISPPHGAGMAVAVGGPPLNPATPGRDILTLADPAAPPQSAICAELTARAGGPLAQSALMAAKIARLLPATLQVPLETADAAAWAHAHDLLTVTADDIQVYRGMVAQRLRKAVEAQVPLAGAENTRIAAFSPADGGIEHLAIIVGDPCPGETVLTRLHSECFTGDLLGSLRCDCGDQLRGALGTIAEAGAGVILYLAQEGRGIGLVNKLRAYRLQDAGADTLEANEALGFDADERLYDPAAAMLNALGFDRLRLLTNNPDKVAALEAHNITVTERVPHRFPANSHNADYLAAKTHRFGHLY